MEADSYKDLPEPAFVRGYMRRYAQLVKLPPDDIAGQFDQCYAADAETPAPDAPPVNPIQLLDEIKPLHWSLNKLLSWGGVAFIILLVLGFLWNSFMSRHHTAPVTAPVVETSSAVLSPVHVPVTTASATSPAQAEEHRTTPGGAASALSTRSVVPASTPVLPSTPVLKVLPSPSAPAPATLPVAPLPAASLSVASAGAKASAKPSEAGASITVGTAGTSAAMPDTLELTLHAQSWVSIRDSRRQLVSALRSAGQITAKGQGPFSVNIGKVSAVTVMTLNGKPVDLRSYTQSDVATMTLKP
jgi:cytoskeleton protein RodZ